MNTAPIITVAGVGSSATGDELRYCEPEPTGAAGSLSGLSAQWVWTSPAATVTLSHRMASLP